MTEIDIYVHTDGSADPKLIKIAEDASVDELIKSIQAAGGTIGELEEEILLLVENDEVLVRREHKLCNRGIKHGHHVHVSKSRHIYVAVVTTSGVWPHKGFDSVPIHQPVKDQLHRAAKHLGITDTTNWVAKVKGKELNVDKNYLENGLRCRVDIDYGPREGGGGDE
jgi:hypothetical protein